MKRPTKQPKATTASEKSQRSAGAKDQSTPTSLTGIGQKVATEVKGEKGAWNKMKAAGRELDREIAGEYERREDEVSLKGKTRANTQRKK